MEPKDDATTKKRELRNGHICFESAFIDQITTESGSAASVESHGACYIQATHFQQISDLSILNDKSISNKVKRYKLSINNIKLI